MSNWTTPLGPLARSGIVVGWLTVGIGSGVTAQGAVPEASAEELDAKAASAFAAGTKAQCAFAASLWKRAATRYEATDRSADAASAFRNTGRALTCAGEPTAALGYYGRAAELDDTAASRRLLVMLDESPLYEPASRGVAKDANFVRAANELLAAVSPTATTVTSAEEAQKALEDLAALRLAPITLKADAPLDVEIRRWVYSITQPNAPWERITTDTTLRRQPAAYQFRYRDPRTGQDTTVMNRCADGCIVVIH